MKNVIKKFNQNFAGAVLPIDLLSYSSGYLSAWTTSRSFPDIRV